LSPTVGAFWHWHASFVFDLWNRFKGPKLSFAPPTTSNTPLPTLPAHFPHTFWLLRVTLHVVFDAVFYTFYVMVCYILYVMLCYVMSGVLCYVICYVWPRHWCIWSHARFDRFDLANDLIV